MGHMNDDLYSDHHWRSLCERLFDCEGDGLGDMLLRWLEEHPAHVAEVRAAGRPESHLIPLVRPPTREYSPLVRLYAMNRILDVLILNYQDPPDDPTASPNEAYPPVGVYPAFCEALGADRIGRRGFHPFFHEVVEVRPVDDPGLLGVRVRHHWWLWCAGQGRAPSVRWKISHELVTKTSRSSGPSGCERSAVRPYRSLR
jgi:hypothetical protein